MSDNLKVFDRVYVNVVGFKVKDENGNTLTFTRGTPSQLGIIVPEQNVTASQAYTQIQFNKEIVVGEEYIVTINDTVKTITAQTISGSLLLAWGNNIYIEYANSSMYFDVLDSSQYGTYTVKVEESSSSSVSLQSKTVTPSETAQTITADSGYDGLSSISVAAISSTYIGSGITQRTSTDLAVNGATVTVPSGHYANQATKSVASGTEGTPTATKGTVSNHQVSVTPSVTNIAGYISGSTKTGTAVIVTAAELASGNKEITENGTDIDVVGYSTVSVDVSGSSYTSWQTLYDGTPSITVSSPNYIVIPNYTTPLQADETYRITWGETTYTFQTKADSRGVSYDGYYVGNSVVIGGTDDGSGISLLLYRDTATRMLGITTDTGTKYLKIEKQITTSANLQAKTNISPTTSSQIITADVGYDGLSSVQINAMPSGTAGTPTASKGTVSNHSISVTPTVTNVSGYIDGGTKTGTAVSVSASELVSGTYSVTSSGTKDVTNYASISVPNGGAETPDTAITANPSISVNASGLITATASASKDITPSVSAGYVSSGTAGTVTVSGSNTQQLTTLGATTYNTSTTDQTITSGKYITGAQTIKAVTTSNLTAANVKAGTTIQVGDANDSDRIASVIGTFTSDATASAGDIKSGETAYVNGTKVTGTLVINKYYVGTSEPVASQYNDGDIYLKVVSN